MASDDDILDRLDRIATLLEVAFADTINSARSELRADPVAAAILDAVADGWVLSGDIKRSVSKTTKVSEKTVQRALSALHDRNALRVRGTGPTTSYRSTGVL